MPYDNNIAFKKPKGNTYIAFLQFIFDFVAIRLYSYIMKGVIELTFGEKLKKLRESRGYGVNQLSLKAGVSSSQISRFEKGERKDPTLETVKKLSKALGVSISYFEEEVNSDNKNIETIAAHIDDDVTEEQMDDILNYIEFIKQKHSKKD